MADRIPPEPPDGALVVIELRTPGDRPRIIATYARDDSRQIGNRRWYPLESAPPLAPWKWKKIWDSANLPDLRIYVATGFVNLWSYNGMEYPK